MVEPCIRQTGGGEEKKKKRLILATKVDSLQLLSVHLLIVLEHRFCLGTRVEQNGQKQGYTIRELLVSYKAT